MAEQLGGRIAAGHIGGNAGRQAGMDKVQQ